MDTNKLKDLRDLNNPTTAFWIWFVASTLAVGIIFGNVFAEPVSRFSSNTEFHVGAMFGGILLAVIANIPAWVLFDMLRRVVLTQQELHFVSWRQATAAKK